MLQSMKLSSKAHLMLVNAYFVIYLEIERKSPLEIPQFLPWSVSMNEVLLNNWNKVSSNKRACDIQSHGSTE